VNSGNISIKNIHIYPNPVTDVLTIEMSVSTDKDLYNGRVVKTELLPSGRTQMGTENLSPGLYFLRIQYGDSYTVKRVVIH